MFLCLCAVFCGYANIWRPRPTDKGGGGGGASAQCRAGPPEGDAESWLGVQVWDSDFYGLFSVHLHFINLKPAFVLFLLLWCWELEVEPHTYYRSTLQRAIFPTLITAINLNKNIPFNCEDTKFRIPALAWVRARGGFKQCVTFLFLGLHGEHLSSLWF